MPLFWGLSGTSCLLLRRQLQNCKGSALGIFGAIALSGVRERLTACYEFIPGDTSNANVHGLGLFLSESVLNFAPLSGDRCSEDKVTQKAD
jgi:hypothetical protein